MRSRYRISSTRLDIHNLSLDIFAPSEIEELLESVTEGDFQKDERLPYWAMLWPSSIALSRYMAKKGFIKKTSRVLELGCGLGHVSLSIASRTPYSFHFDYEKEALKFCELNYLSNQNKILHKPNFFLMDWRSPSLKAPFDFIIGSDVLYEERFFLPLKKLFKKYLKPGGSLFLSEPGRRISAEFINRLKKDYKYECIKILYEDPKNNVKQDISIHHLKYERI